MTTDVAARGVTEGVPGVDDGVDGDPCVEGVGLARPATGGRVDAPPVGDSPSEVAVCGAGTVEDTGEGGVATEPAALHPASPITSVAAATPTVSRDPGRRRSIVYRQGSKGAAGRGGQPDA